MAKVTRRRFLSKTAVAAGVVFAGPSLFDLDELMAQPNWVRPDIATASKAIIDGYKTAIVAMRKLPDTNPVSWAYQAAIHGSLSATTRTAWKTCQHGNFFFLSWHRMYLYWFERIVRKMSGLPSWALPYWNYKATPADPVAANRVLPLPFRSPANETTNALFTTHRNTTINNGTGSLSATICNAATALSQTQFTGPAVNFGGNNPGSGQLELTPHNAVHNAIGGWMGDPRTAAQDPIFWLHHANIDRYWNVWLKQGGRSDPTNNTTWRNKVFTFFNENGAQVTMTACDILNASMQLHYTYAGEPAQVTQSCPPKITLPPLRFVERPLRVPIPDPEMLINEARPVTRVMQMRAVAAEVMRDAKAAILAPDKSLNLNFGSVIADAPTGTVFEVWVGTEGTPGPGVAGAKKVGDFSLFAQGVRGAGHDHEAEAASLSFRLDDAVGPILAKNAADIRVSVIPVDPVEVAGKRNLKRPNAPIHITAMSVTVEEAAK